ncbi:hypothetical protein [Sphingomonas sp. AX6]|uniref:hypothetical protein n=1 Tax=Sphingomonas sp. AX6 TaxID=2653171 RepID=UPI0012F22CA9|nr:hypothetical protein [Sphingomonas sp. AX6]VXC72782.1 conserved exported hypothetical protein [Sphingomonas sp. AX6]
MTGASLLALLMRMIAALMLATIGVHAAAPASQPLERGHGSAFSASTYNVSLKSDRESAAVERLSIEPVGDGIPTIEPRFVPTIDADRPLRANRSRAPPTTPRLTRPSPRGPPTIRT